MVIIKVDYGTIGGGSQTATTLWSNQNTGDAFSPTIVLLSQSMENFDALRFHFAASRYNPANATYFDMPVSEFKGMGLDSDNTPKIAIGGRVSGSTYLRTVSFVSNTQVRFGVANLYGGSGQTTNYTIPIKIEGLK